MTNEQQPMAVQQGILEAQAPLGVLQGIKNMVAHARSRCHSNMSDFDIVLSERLFAQLRVEMSEAGYWLPQEGEPIEINTANGPTKVLQRS